jgi:hypothetical protein
MHAVDNLHGPMFWLKMGVYGRACGVSGVERAVCDEVLWRAPCSDVGEPDAEVQRGNARKQLLKIR